MNLKIHYIKRNTNPSMMSKDSKYKRILRCIHGKRKKTQKRYGNIFSENYGRNCNNHKIV